MTPDHRTGEQIQADTLARLNRESAREDAAAPARITVVYVKGHEDQPVAAPCCLSGCQYGTVEAQLAARDAALQDALNSIQTLEATWRDEANRRRPLECAPVSAAKREGVLRWMLLSNCANALAPILARLRASLAPQEPQK